MGHWCGFTNIDRFQGLRYIPKNLHRDIPTIHLVWSLHKRRLTKLHSDTFVAQSDTIKTKSRKIRSHVSHPTSAGKWADIIELQAKHFMPSEQWTWIFCSDRRQNYMTIQEQQTRICSRTNLRNERYFPSISGPGRQCVSDNRPFVATRLRISVNRQSPIRQFLVSRSQERFSLVSGGTFGFNVMNLFCFFFSDYKLNKSTNMSILMFLLFE